MKTTRVLNLGREFRIATCDPIMTLNTVSSTHLLTECDQNNEFEYIYAMREIINDVLALKKGESMYFQPNRNDSYSKGIIRRIL